MMNNNSYTFLKISSQEILIIFLTRERPDEYFKSLSYELREYALDADLYFDFLVNNGPNDRFYSACFEKGNLKLNSFRKAKNSDKFTEIANRYFANHWEIIEQNSVLTNFQKSFFKRKLEINASSDFD